MDTNYNVENTASEIIEKVHEAYSKLNKFNVMILGKTGAGKSTLINNIFRVDLAKTGLGMPITDQIRKIEISDYPLAIYDTPGLEMSGKNAVDNLLDEVLGEIRSGIRSGDMNQMIHCIWYCVATPSHRFEEAEIYFLKNFFGKASSFKIPVIIVMTQSYSNSDANLLRNKILSENLPVRDIVPVLAEDFEFDGGTCGTCIWSG